MKMSPAELVFRILLAIFFPPFGPIGLEGVGCGTVLLLCILTALFWVPGLIVSCIIIINEYSRPK